MPFTFRTTLTLAAVAGMAAAAAAAIAATRLAPATATDARTAANDDPSLASIRQVFCVHDQPDENIDFIIQVFSSGPNGDDLSQESISRICDFFSAVTDLSDCQIKTIGSCLASADETIAVSTAAFLRATILASRWQDSADLEHRLCALLLGIVGEIKHPLVQVNVLHALTDIVANAEKLIPCFVAKASLDHVLPLAYQSSSESDQRHSTALHFFATLLQQPHFSPEFNSLHYANLLWDGIMDSSLEVSRRDVYAQFLSNLMLVKDSTPSDLAYQWADVISKEDILELLQSGHECLRSAAYFAITLQFLANQKEDAVSSLGDNVFDAFLSTFDSCSSRFATLSLCALVSANDAFARKLLSSLKLGKLISTPDAASNLENIGKIQSALVCANVQTIPTIQKLLREMPFIQLAYDNVHDAHTMPVALRFLLTFDPDARSKLLDLFVKQSDALAAELTSSTEGIDSDSLRAFMYSVYCLLAETSARDTRFTRQRLIKNGKLLDILRFASSEPSVRFYPATYQLAGALCEDESLVPMIVDAFHRPLLAHLHPSMNDLVSAIEVVLDSVRGQPATSIDNAAVDAAGQLYFSTVSWFHHSFSHALKPPVVATLVELPDVGLSQILDCLKQLLNMNILDSEKHPFAHRNRPKALDLYFNRNQHCIKSGWSTRWHEFDAYVAFTESCALLPSVMRSVCLVLSELADFDVTRPQCLEILPTVPALLFSTSSSNDSFFRNLLQAPSDVFDHYYEWIAAHYSTVVQLDCSSFANKSNLLLVEALERSCIRSPTVDAVHWASMTGNVQTSVRGTMVFNFSQHQQQLRGSHGVTGKGKYCFTVFSPDESGIICGWTTYTGPLAWNKCLFKHAQDEGELQTVVVDYDDICAWNTGKYRNTIMTPVPNSVVTCVLDLDAGVFTAALNDMPFHVIFDNLDCSQTWYPVLFPQADTVVDTDFNDTMREVSGIPLGLAPACDLTRHPDARLPQPAADQPAAAVHDYAPIASNDAPVLDSEQVAELTIHNYYEAKLTPSQTNHVLAAGFRMDNFYTLWIGTHQIELAVQFFLQDDGPVEDSVPWRKWIPVVVDHLLQNDEATMPDRFGVKFTPENDAVANVIELSSSAISEIQLNVCGYCVREGCAGFLFKDLDPICSSPINLGVAIVADKSGSRSFAVTKGLDTAFASDMFPWAFVGQSHVMTPLLIHARSVTLNMHSDLEAPESWALVGPLIQGRKREDLQTWFENCKA